jgi:hypothetical protein
MPHAQLTEAVRRLVTETFARLGVDGAEAIRESILIRQGLYCGRRFETAGGYAIWFAEENQVKVFQDGGHVVDVLQLASALAAPPAQRLAA